MSNLIDMEIINSSDFDYDKLDENTSHELQKIASNISAINSNIKYLVGEELARAQELLAKNGYGCFGEWIESYGMKKRTAYNCINYYKVFVQNLHEQEKLKQLPASKIYELGKLETEQQKEVLKNVNLKDMTNQEVKDLTKQLKAEKEYSEELQEAIRDKETQINELKERIENIKIPEKEIIEREVIKEVVPDSIKSQVEQLEKEKTELFKKYEEAKSTIVSMNNIKNNEIGQKYYDYDFDGLASEIASFVRNTSKYTYMEQEYSELPISKKTLLRNAIKKIETWLLDMKKAMNENLMIGNNIYLEEENEDE